MILFGAVQIILSQIPNFNNLWWLSIVAAVMSFSYSLIGLGLGVGKVIGKADFLFLGFTGVHFFLISLLVIIACGFENVHIQNFNRRMLCYFLFDLEVKNLKCRHMNPLI